jgi:hypothetical protein
MAGWVDVSSTNARQLFARQHGDDALAADLGSQADSAGGATLEHAPDHTCVAPEGMLAHALDQGRRAAFRHDRE